MRVIVKHVYVTGDELVGSSQIFQPDFLTWCNRVELDLILIFMSICVLHIVWVSSAIGHVLIKRDNAST